MCIAKLLATAIAASSIAPLTTFTSIRSLTAEKKTRVAPGQRFRLSRWGAKAIREEEYRRALASTSTIQVPLVCRRCLIRLTGNVKLKVVSIFERKRTGNLVPIHRDNGLARDGSSHHCRPFAEQA
jgi:hypothetical protein